MPIQHSQDLDTLLGDLRTGNAEMRDAAARGLGAQAEKIRQMWLDEGPGSPAVTALIAALDDSEGQVRSDAADALAALGGPAIEAVPALLSLIDKDQELDVAVTATWALYEIAQDSGIGSYNAAAISVLARALKHTATDMRIAAASALGSLVLVDPREAIAALQPVARHDDDAQVRNAALASIEALSTGTNLT